MDSEKRDALERCCWAVQAAVYKAQAAAVAADMDFSTEWREAVGKILDAAERLKVDANDIMEREAVE